MEERVLQFRVGVLVAATVIIAVILIVIFEDLPQGLGGRKTVYIHFPSAPGVTVNTPVRKSGILVGRVTAVDLQDDGGVLITARLNADKKIKTNEICRIGTGNFLGDAMLEFVNDGNAPISQQTLEDGAYLEGVVSKDAISMMSDAMQVFTTLSTDLQVALSSVEEAGSDRLPQAIPVICDPGDVAMTSRQAIHGSFANTSSKVRVTINFGFHRRSSVLGIRSGGVHNPVSEYDEDYIFERSKAIAWGIDARSQHFPNEDRYVYEPFRGLEEQFVWTEETKSNLRDYNLRDIGI